jgi:hypothetical protein
MKRILLLFVALLLLCCTKQVTYLKYDFLPTKLNADSIFYNPPKMNDVKLNDHQLIALNSGVGKVCANDSCTKVKDLTLPSGVLFSDKATYEYGYLKTVFPVMIQRLAISKDLFKSYQDNIYRVDTLYNNRIVALEKQNERTWLEKNSIYMGFIFGVISAITIEFATNKVK